VQVESIAYISARGDLLAGLLAIAATLAALRAAEERDGRAGRRAWALVAALAFAAAVFTKESVIGAPLAIAGILWSKQQLRAGRVTLLALGVVIVLYFIVRSLATVPTTGGALGAAILQLPGVCLEYLRIAFLPFDLSTERVHHTGLAVVGWVAAVALVGGAIYARRRYPVAIAGAIWFVALLGPASVAVTSSGVAADRYLYAPLVGLAIAITAIGAAIVDAWPRFRRPLQAVLAAWGALLVVVTFLQVPVWRSNETLYQHAVAMSPDSSNAFYRLGYLAAAADDWDRAIPLLERAIELDPNNQRALNNLGVGLLRTGRAADAESVLGRAVAVNPASFRGWLNLGLARLAVGKQADGCSAVSRALEINPSYAPAVQTQRARCR
jgi:tetratricopeptide (TPR) repeat protein